MDNPLSPVDRRSQPKHLLEVSAAQQRQQELLHQQRRGSVRVAPLTFKVPRMKMHVVEFANKIDPDEVAQI